MPQYATRLKRLKAEEIPLIRRDPVDPKARTVAEPIVEAVKAEGEKAVRRFAEQFGELVPGAKLVYGLADGLISAAQQKQTGVELVPMVIYVQRLAHGMR